MNLAPSEKAAAADVITVRGRILDGEGAPVPDAVLEIWRANENGEYAGSGSSAAGNGDGVPEGFGRVATNDQGEFSFSTIRPVSIRDESGQTQAPHLVVLIFMRGLLRQLLTRIYFAESAGNSDDPVLQLVPVNRRETLIATRAADHSDQYLWDVRLQGVRETVFFEA